MRRLRFGLCVALGLMGLGGASLAGCPAGPDDPVWYLAACEISGNEQGLDALLEESRGSLTSGFPGVEIPDAMNAMIALGSKSYEAPVAFFPAIDGEIGDPDNFSDRLPYLFHKAKFDRTNEEFDSLLNLEMTMRVSGIVLHTAPYVGWLDLVARRRGYRLLFIDFGVPSHGIAIVTPVQFCRWVNVELDGLVGFVGEWHETVGEGLSEAVEWSDRPRDDCVGA